MRADLVIVAPAEGASVAAPVPVVIAAQEGGGTGSADFTLSVDGQPVDRLGAVGSGAAFTSLSLAAGKSITISVRGLADGGHQLKVGYAAHDDNPKPDIVRNFVVSSSGAAGGRRRGVLLVVVLILLPVIAATVLRRKRLHQRVRRLGRYR
ncbi:MAG: hypothetical protein ABI912_12510 [Actinomycetota bacterium]